MPDVNTTLIDQGAKQIRLAEQILAATRQTTAASIASGIIAASGKVHTVDDAKVVFDDVYWTLYPEPGFGRYMLWRSAKAERDAAAASVIPAQEVP